MIALLIFFIGGVLLFGGGELLVKGSSTLAQHYKLSKIFVGSIIIGFGTSMPEMVVSIEAALQGSEGVAFGNIIGSNISNILLVFGVSTLICPILNLRKGSLYGILWLTLSTILAGILFLKGNLGFYIGVLLLSLTFAYVLFPFLKKKNKADPSSLDEIEMSSRFSLLSSLIMVLSGILLLIWGGNIFINSALVIARLFHISEEAIGLSIVAFGTSLPELSTAIVASLKRENGIVVGNVIGSSVFNILGVLGVTIFFKELTVPKHIINFDYWIMAIISLIFVLTLWRKKT